MKYYPPLAITAIFLTGCVAPSGQVVSPVVTQPAVTQPAVTQPVVTNPQPEPPMAQPLTPNIAVGPPTNYSAEIPYYNISATPVLVRSSPAADAPVIGQLAKGGGGIIDICVVGGNRCRIEFGGAGQKGWVDMTTMGGRAS